MMEGQEEGRRENGVSSCPLLAYLPFVHLPTSLTSIPIVQRPAAPRRRARRAPPRREAPGACCCRDGRQEAGCRGPKEGRRCRERAAEAEPPQQLLLGGRVQGRGWVQAAVAARAGWRCTPPRVVV